MSNHIHILYLSGFGNKYDAMRLRLLSWWRYRHVTVELVPMKWEGNETFEQKIARIDQAIDRIKDGRVVLIGESAGGSMAVHMAARRPDELFRVMALCGKNSHPETVGENYYRRSPAFRSSMEALNDSITALPDSQRRNFVSIHPLYDSVVPVRETLLSGCRSVWLPSIGHFTTIVLALSVLSPLMVRAARRK